MSRNHSSSPLATSSFPVKRAASRSSSRAGSASSAKRNLKDPSDEDDAMDSAEVDDESSELASSDDYEVGLLLCLASSA